MPERKITREWFSKQCWLEIFGESIPEDPDNAERIMVLMISLRHLIMGSWSERRLAAHAVNNCIRACTPFIRTQVLAEKMQWELRQRQRRHSC